MGRLRAPLGRALTAGRRSLLPRCAPRRRAAPPRTQRRHACFSQCEFRFRLHLFKAKLQLLHRNIKTSKKELKSALEIYQRAFRQPGAAAADLSEDGAAFDAAAAAASETVRRRAGAAIAATR